MKTIIKLKQPEFDRMWKEMSIRVEELGEAALKDDSTPDPDTIIDDILQILANHNIDIIIDKEV